ncbi:hypothetical protein [Rhodococcus sp. ARC_M6]|uniref:hypothetical protein n=1 Tax=Rhodococcus sp. ARC_M6 TaxID=2928852 RepID=UPI001FB1E1B3|nr:hypothetical protein [Rhodococcus sp. ARC_M6]MCJ0906390.1 hypothetical protein [Rhodococcus sp. ARC_M6]
MDGAVVIDGAAALGEDAKVDDAPPLDEVVASEQATSNVDADAAAAKMASLRRSEIGCDIVFPLIG